MQLTALLAALLVAGASAWVPATAGLVRPALRRVAAPQTVMMAGESPVQGYSVVLLAGGVGSRMKAGMPKQFLQLRGKTVLMHSIELFLNLDGVREVVLVIAEEYRDQFDAVRKTDAGAKLKFALPGKERQDSVESGVAAIDAASPLVAIHDAARPLVTEQEIFNVLADAQEHGAAVLGVLMKATVKESADGQFVLKTVDRSRLWEVQTPQVIKPALLKDGFAQVKARQLEVTDDVSIIEQLGLPVKLTLGEYTNIKLTTPDDMQVAEQILRSRDPPASGNLLRRLARKAKKLVGK